MKLDDLRKDDKEKLITENQQLKADNQVIQKGSGIGGT